MVLMVIFSSRISPLTSTVIFLVRSPVVRQSEAAAGSITGIDVKAGGADGAQQQAQVGNLYLSSIAGEAVKANTLAAQKTLQEKTADEQKRAAMAELFSGKAPMGDDF